MRHIHLAILLTVSACSARAPRPTTPVRYACDELALVRDGDALTVSWPGSGRSETLAPVSRDDETSHYSIDAVDYAVPHDPFADVTAKAHAKQMRCTPRVGYTEAFTLYARGSSMGEVAARLGLGGAEEASSLVHHAMLGVVRRYYRER